MQRFGGLLKEPSGTRTDVQMRVLWLSGRPLSLEDSGLSGTWLQAIAQSLVESGEVQLANIAQGPVPSMVRCDYGRIQQWIVPLSYRRTRSHLPEAKFVARVVEAVQEFRPDVVSVWGTESFWGLLTARKIIQGPAVLLEMQGLKLAVARCFHGGLSFAERLACMGLKEVLRGKGIRRQEKEFRRWGALEREIIEGHSDISTPSPWMKAQVGAINDRARIFSVDLPLRGPFYQREPWEGSDKHRIFCSAAYSHPFKGLHVAVRATALLKRVFPGIQLRIAGQHRKLGLRRDGYISWVNREIRRLGLEMQVVWLGPLDAAQIISELRVSSAALIPSFVESYGLALCEAMMLGVPTVTSFTGGTAYLARDEESCLFYPPDDTEMCAYQLARLLTGNGLAERLSQNARATALARNDPSLLARRRIEIYRAILESPVCL